METVIAILLLLLLVVLGVCMILSWVRYNVEGRGGRYLAGALATTTFAVVGFWYIFFSGALS
jgi:hypothetical protein